MAANDPHAESSGIIPAPSPATLGELHLDLSARLLQLEIFAATYQHRHRKALVRDYIRTAISLRSLLLRLSMATRVAGRDASTGFEAALGDSLRRAYLWAIEDVESLSGVLADPRVDARGMQRHGNPLVLTRASVSELEAAGEAADRVICELSAIDEAVSQLVMRRDQIEGSDPRTVDIQRTHG